VLLENLVQMTELVTERILIAYFENRATPHEKLLIKQWLRDGNEEIFYQQLAKWEASHQQFVPDQNAALDKYRKFLEGNLDEKVVPIHAAEARSIHSAGLFRYASVAAAAIALLCVAFYFGQNYFSYEHYSTSYGMTKNILLPDGSEVTLNANSTLKVPKDLAENSEREVWLDGEAFFSVAKRPNRVRFFVHTDNLSVEVLGTKFNVNNRRGKTEVVLSEGKVKLTSNQNATDTVVYMKPGDFVSLAKVDPAFRKRIVKPENFTTWKSNSLSFEETPLSQVAEKIEDYYGVTIEIADKDLAARQLTGTLPNNDLGVVLRSLSSAHNLIIQRDDDRIVFK
jgi:transmembrane sensor